MVASRMPPGRRRAAGRWLLALAPVLVAPGVAAVSPRTGDLATAFALGADRAVGGQDSGTGGTFQISQEIYWTAANAVRITVGSLDVDAAPGAGRGRMSALYLTGNVSHNWLRRSAFPYVTGGVGLYVREEATPSGGDHDSLEVGVNAGAGLEVRLGDDVTLRFEALLHALTGGGPHTVASGSLGVAFYY